jgi:uncharacterized protein
MSRKTSSPHVNPFKFGPLALDDSFADRDQELATLIADMRNGQDSLVYAPRRYGKSSLVLTAAQRVTDEGVLVGYCDIVRATTKEKLAAAIAETIHRDIASATGQALDRAAELFRNLRIRPTLEFDQSGSISFSFRVSNRRADIDETLEVLLELLGRIAVERGRRVVMIFDEFQEIIEIDRHLPRLLRSVFQAQPDVGHVYLGSRRHLVDAIFNDENEPFWRSAKKLALGPIPPQEFASFIRSRFEGTDKGVDDDALSQLLEITGGHPYATQELAYELWQIVPNGFAAHAADVDAALDAVLRAENSDFETLWENAPGVQRRVMAALALEATSSPYSETYRRTHDLPATSTVQSAISALVKKELVARADDGTFGLVEPFLADWIRREPRPPSLGSQLAL